VRLGLCSPQLARGVTCHSTSTTYDHVCTIPVVLYTILYYHHVLAWATTHHGQDIDPARSMTMTTARIRVHVGSLLTRETGSCAWILVTIDGSISIRRSRRDTVRDVNPAPCR